MRKAIIVVSVAALVIGAVFPVPRVRNWVGWPFVLLILFGTALFFLVRRHAGSCGYQCPECSHRFRITPWTDFLSPQVIGKLLCCPRCGVSSWCVEISRAEAAADPEGESSVPTPRRINRVLYLHVGLVAAVYAALWFFTLMFLHRGGYSGALLRTPLAAAILVMLHLVFCLFGARNGYRSRIYAVMTAFVLIFLGLSLWMQVLHFGR